MASGGGGDGSSDTDSKSSDKDVDNMIQAFAKCKWFNVGKGFGFVSLEEPVEGAEEGTPPPDIFVYQSVIKMDGFRSLREGEPVMVKYKKSDKGFEAVQVAARDGSDCLGSEKRPKRRKKTADRCYNCDESGHHAKECTLPPLPKRCHHCKSVDHLVADCPLKRDRNAPTSQGDYPSYTTEPQSNNHNSTSLPPSTSQTGQFDQNNRFTQH